MALQLEVARIPVRIRPDFFLGSVLIGADRISEPLLLAWWILAVGVFVGVHELGHAFMFRRFGHHPTIELQMFGGLTAGTPGRPLLPMQDLAVSLAGPAMGLLVGGTVWLLTEATGFSPPSRLIAIVLSDILWINIGWSVINLLPMLPLDGGRALSAVMTHFLGPSGRRAAYMISLVMAVVALAFALATGRTWGAMLAAMFAFANYQALRPLPRM